MKTLYSSLISVCEYVNAPYMDSIIYHQILCVGGLASQLNKSKN